MMEMSGDITDTILYTVKYSQIGITCSGFDDFQVIHDFVRNE